MNRIAVMLDNGHGFDTKGKRSPDGNLLEYQYSREIVELIKTNLKLNHIEYFIVTPELSDISLSKRVSRVNNQYKKYRNCGIDSILISVHVNASKNGDWGSATGWEVYTSIGQTGGDKLADCIFESAKNILSPLNKRLRFDTSDGDADKESNFYILKNTICPAVLTENFFMDTKSECEWLLRDSTKILLAELHTNGILNYINRYGY